MLSPATGRVQGVRMAIDAATPPPSHLWIPAPSITQPVKHAPGARAPERLSPQCRLFPFSLAPEGSGLQKPVKHGPALLQSPEQQSHHPPPLPHLRVPPSSTQSVKHGPALLRPVHDEVGGPVHKVTVLLVQLLQPRRNLC